MFRVALEVILQGIPEEQKCIAGLRELMSSGGTCAGSQSSFVCAYANTLVKVLLAEESSKALQQAFFTGSLRGLIMQVIVEGENPEGVVKIVDLVYRLLRECNILVRIIS